MSIYENLMLNCGGGIISKNDKSDQHEGTASVCIGIGGTGVAALSDLKGKIYQQLNPDNPDDAVPKYEGIQLLAIDSDDGAYKMFGGKRRLADTEFFSIKRDNLATLLSDPIGKALIKDSHQNRWMEIDHISALLSPEGAGGVRQIGRFLLFERAASLVSKIQEICSAALRKRNCNSLDVYIFAGISGGTGSGCFLDVCYLVRHVIRTAGWNAKIMGYFFLPDVVTSKPEVAARPASVAYNNSNGYAAMKELDYLMSLQTANDYFEQNYAAGITVRTQEPPVDMCHLISAQQADGRMIPNGFDYGINVASDYAMAYLAKVDTGNDAEDESGLTMRGHLANVARGVLGIPRRYGANLSYHILGASNAELPLCQINTYLAIGFMRKFYQNAYRPRNSVTNDLVTAFMTENRLRVQDVFEDVTSDAPGLVLPEIDAASLACEPCCERGKLPRVWAQAVNDWYSKCRGTRQRNATNLTQELVDFGYASNNDQSLVGRLFRGLYKLSTNPEKGPYYAAAMLINNGQDLYATLNGEIEKAENQARAQQIQIPGAEDWVIQCNQNLIDARKGGPQKKAYVNFVAAVQDYVSYVNAYEQCIKTKEVLETFRRQVRDLYNSFFNPLRELLDNLHETFEANAAYLLTPESKKPNAFTWQILELADVQERLDLAVKELDAPTMINRFMEALLEAPDAWRTGDQDKITLMIRNYMLKLFEEQTSRSLRDYLADKFPRGKNDPQALIDEIKTHIISKVDQRAVPLFWCDPTYNLSSADFTFSTSSLSVPQICTEVCSAAVEYVANAANEYTVRKTGIKDRIFALRFVSGIPLFAYHGITKLKDDYDAALGNAAGAGIHLYAYTGRGDDGSGHKEWRQFLPTPMPYSKVRNVNSGLVHDGEALTELYKQALALGIIGKVPDVMNQAAAQNQAAANAPKNAGYAIFTTPDLDIADYTLQDFLDNGDFKHNEYNKVLAELKQALEILHKFGVNPRCTKVELKNDGNERICNPEDVRIDYFIQYPKLQAMVRQEIAKRQKLEAAIAKLEEIGAEFNWRTEAMDKFTNLLFFRELACENNEGNVSYDKTASVKCFYENQYGEKMELVLSDRTMKYGRYPLYQAFRSYLSLAKINVANPENMDLENHSMKELQGLQADLNGRADDLTKQRRKESDYIVPALLGLIWNSASYYELVSETLRNTAEAEKADIARFYSDLIERINALKNESSSWPRTRSVEELASQLSGGSQTTGTAAPVQQAYWVLYENRQLELYPASSRCWAYDRPVDKWIPLNPNMCIAINGRWVPIQLDAQGNVIL